LPGCLPSNASTQDAVLKHSPQGQANNQELGGDKMSAAVATQRRIEHANEDNFEQMVLQSTVPVLVDFYADWCRPCRALAPVLEELARETPNAKVVKVNVDEAPRLAARYRIDGIPALLVFRNGELAAQRAGLQSKTALQGLLQ
jgi:thioredoxin 1